MKETYNQSKIAFHKKKIKNATTKGEKTLEKTITGKLELELANLLE